MKGTGSVRDAGGGRGEEEEKGGGGVGAETMLSGLVLSGCHQVTDVGLR